MSSKWDQFAEPVTSSNKWDQYSVKKPSAIKEVAREALVAPVTGFLGAYGNIQNLIAGGKQERLSPGQQALTTAEQQVPESQLPFLQDDDILPQLSKLPTTQEGRQVLGAPEPQTFLGGATKRAGEFIGTGAAFGANPMNAILSSVGAGTAGQTAQELGFGPIGQAVAETIGGSIPSLRGIIRPNTTNAEAIAFLRAEGLTEQQIAPLIQSQRKVGFFGTIAKKGRRANQALENSQRGLSEIYDRLGTHPSANIPMNPSQAQTFANEMRAVAADLPAELRQRVFQDAVDLARDGFTGNGLMNFWKDLNYYIPRGARQLGRFKGAIDNALERFSPELARDFRLTTQIQRNFYNIAGRLRTNIVDQFIGASEVGRIIYGIRTGNGPLLIETIGETAARELAREVLINPRFQNLSRQIITALNAGKMGLANSYIDKIGKLVAKKDKELGKKIEKFDVNQVLGDDVD